MILLRNVVVISVLLVGIPVLGTGCSKKSRTSDTKSNAWFESTFARLPRLEPVSVAPAEWRAIQARDALVVRLGPGYHARNNFCWAKNEGRWPGPGWIDVCLSRDDPAMAEFTFTFQLQPAVTGDAQAELSDDPQMTDMVVYDSWRAEAGSLAGRRAIVERARATGGMAGYRRQRKMSALIELRPGDFVQLTGSTGDDRGYDELLTIAATVQSGTQPAP